MTVNELKEYCLSKSGTSPDFPFDNETLVLKVGNRMFALVNINIKPVKTNLKCDPLLSGDLRSEFKEIEPGYHMNKKHWNTVNCEGNLPDEEIKKLIDMSYELVVKSLTKKEREKL